MDRVPISFDEKVDARFTRLNRNACWLWEGSLIHGRPAINLQHVTRYIYEREREQIPAGYSLWRTDHTVGCQRGKRCRHWLCVNPWHVELRPIPNGAYQRDIERDITESTEHVREYKMRALSRRKQHDRTTDPQGVSLDADEGRPA